MNIIIPRLLVVIMSLMSLNYAFPQMRTQYGDPRVKNGIPSWFAQKQDHFDKSNTNTWNQAYFVNDTFWSSGSDAPVVLCIGGEGPMHSIYCHLGLHIARELGGLVFGVEHRYYGCHNKSACPYDDKTPNHLQYLSSRQALADLAEFHKYASGQYGLTTKNKWVSFGGSYPGMLSGWSRLQYPNLIHAAVANSAPVLGELDYKEFNNIVARAYSLKSVGGSDTCQKSIADGHKIIDSLFKTEEGRQKLAKLFPKQVSSADWLKTRIHQRDFVGCGVTYFPAQGNRPTSTRPAGNIELICKIMTDTTVGDEVDRLAKVATATRFGYDHPCEIDWTGENPTGGYWGYQTCTEFGFYQSCEMSTECFYDQGLISFNDPEKIPSSFCVTEYNVTLDETVAAIKASNEYYGGRTPKGSRVFWANGNVDPWHGNSVLKSPSPDQPVLMVEGGSHCEWESNPSPGELPSLEPARQKIYAQVKAWLKED